MVHVYYHIYAVDGVESIINEQLSLIEKHFNFPYILNVGISIANDNSTNDKIIEKFYNYSKPNYRIRDIRCGGNEFVTLDLIEKDIQKFGDTDYILYIHTKGASKQNDMNYKNIISWRHLMNYFNIEKVNYVFEVFEKTDYNTYGCLLTNTIKLHYSGNFWWSTSSYIKTLNFEDIKKTNRFQAELNYISNGKNWKPYSDYSIKQKNYYLIKFNRNEYEK